MNEITMYTGKNQTVKVDLDNLLANVTIIKSLNYDVAKKYRDFISALEVFIEAYGYNVDIIDKNSYLMAVSNLENIDTRIKNDIAKMAVEVSKKEKSVMVESNVVEEVVVETVNNKNKEEMVNMLNKVNEVKCNMEAAVADMMDKFTEAKDSIKVGAGETKEEYFNKVDNSLNVVKGAFSDVLNKIDDLLGYSVLKDDILEIIEAGCNEKTSKKDLFRMAAKCREVIEIKIAKVEKLGNPDKAATLKELIGNVKEESIFTMFFSTMTWIAKKVARKLRKWFKVDEEKSIIGSICRSIGGFAGILRAGAKIVWNTAKFAVSFVIAGAIKIADFIYRAAMIVISKIKEFVIFKFNKLTEKDFEDDFEEDDLDDDFFVDEE